MSINKKVFEEKGWIELNNLNITLENIMDIKHKAQQGDTDTSTSVPTNLQNQNIQNLL